MALRILSSDVADFNLVQLVKQSDNWRRPVVVPDSAVTRAHSRGGQVRVAGTPMAGMMVADILWKTADAVVMEDEVPSVNININFQTRGHMHTQFNGLHHELDMRPGRHNLVCTPEPGDRHQIGANDELEMLHISIDRTYFRDLIGTEGRWSNRVLRELDADRPFSGMDGTGAITPAMEQLIRQIRTPPPAGPMHNLLQQSRVMELLALQLEQFAAHYAAASTPRIAPGDTDKLWRLKQHLDQYFLEEHSLTQLSQLFLLNEFKLKKGFRELFGTTVFGYLKNLRMSHATQLLRDHRLQVEEVADLLGYEHAHHFSAAFKKHFGTSPSARKGSGF